MVISTKIRNSAALLIKILIGIVSFAFIYYQLAYKKNLSELFTVFVEDLQKPLVLMGVLGVVVLMLCNWLTEALKWRYLINIITTISFFKSFKAVIIGINTSIFMPNRIGEFVGRIFILEPKVRIQAVILTFAGNFAQFLVTVIFGTLGLCWYFSLDSSDGLVQKDYVKHIALLAAVVLSIGLLLMYFNLNRFLPLLRWVFKKRKYMRYFIILRKLKTQYLLKVLLYSALRYFIFSFQFWLLLLLFNVNISIISGFLVIFLIFYVLTIVPTIALVEIGVRGAVSVFIINLCIGPLSDSQQLAVVFVAMLLWLINLAFPALMGLFWLKDMHFFNNKTA